MKDIIKMLENGEKVELEDALELINQYKISYIQYTDEINNMEGYNIHVDQCVIQHWEGRYQYNFISEMNPFQTLSIDANHVRSYEVQFAETCSDADVTIRMELKNDNKLKIEIPNVKSAEKSMWKAKEVFEYSFGKFIKKAFKGRQPVCEDVIITNEYGISFRAAQANLEFEYSHDGNDIRIFDESYELNYSRFRGMFLTYGNTDGRDWMRFIIRISPFSTMELTFPLSYQEYADIFEEYKKCAYCEKWRLADWIDKNGYCKNCIEQYNLYPNDESSEKAAEETQEPEENNVESTTESSAERDEDSYYRENDYDDENHTSLEEEYNYDEDAMQTDPRYWDRFF